MNGGLGGVRAAVAADAAGRVRQLGKDWTQDATGPEGGSASAQEAGEALAATMAMVRAKERIADRLEVLLLDRRTPGGHVTVRAEDGAPLYVLNQS
ncbi:hypothetical protein AB0L59_13500 [Streptomyces sp. NPDC052109]|uniref:hypothetical protein n=1 Tax=Streptomyces sp. NPDC052109 TaxID=3155527 RepID=UPI00341A9596